MSGPTYPKPETHQGSYLGRKPASHATIRKFLRKNARDCQIPNAKYSDIVRGTPYESRWIAT